MKKLLISGASGYIGRNFLKLFANKYEIIALTRSKDSLHEYMNLVEVMTMEEFMESNLDLSGAYLLNMAFPRESDVKILLDSFDFTYEFLAKAKALGVKKIVNISSQSVYDINRSSQAYESDLVKVFSLYGMAKIYMESYIEDFAKANSCDFVHLRLGSIIGPNFDQRFINKFVYKRMACEDIAVIEKGERFSFLNVVDACTGIDAIISMDDSHWNQVYNLGAADEYSISDVVKTVELVLGEEYGGKIEIEESSDRSSKTNKVSIDKIKKATMWEPTFDLEKSVEAIWLSKK